MPVAAAALTSALVACSAASPQLTPPAQPAAALGVPRANGTPRSWMDAEAAKKPLLYVSDLTAGNVYAYTYPKGRLVGTLVNVGAPDGLCTDAAGHLWVVNSQAEELVEYDHGGTTPIATLRDPGFWPSDCAVDPKTGDLAVANVFTQEGQPTPGNLVIYERAKGKPRSLVAQSIVNYMYVTYDDRGNLFVDGFGASSNDFALVEIPAGKNVFRPIALDQSIGNGNTADVKWDGKYLAVGDAGANAIYQFTVRGSKGTKVGTTVLTNVYSGYLGHVCFPRTGAATAQSKRVVVPNNNDVGYWNYPAGGNSTYNVTTSLTFAYAAALSKPR